MKLKTKFLYVLFALTIMIGCVAYYVSVMNARTLIKQQATAYAYTTQKKFADLRTQDVHMLSLGARFFLEDQRARDAFRAGDRTTLEQIMTPIFSEIRDAYGVTHFNFITTDGTIFLRMQDPSTYGDTVQRIAFQRAIISQNMESSVELGKNSFALRVITPYYDGDAVIGYVELGREITNFLDMFSYETGDDFAIYGAKSHLNREDFAASMSRKGQDDLWETRPYDVLLATTRTNFRIATQCATDLDTTTLSIDQPLYKELRINDRTYFCTGFPVSNEDGTPIAAVIAAHDMTSILASNHRMFLFEIITIIGIFTIFFIIFYILLHRIVIRPVKELTRTSTQIADGDFSQKITYVSKDEIGELAAFFNTMTRQLADHDQKMKGILAEQEKARLLSDALAHDLDKFKRAADSASDFIIITDVLGKIVYANAAAEDMSGLSHDDIFTLSDAASHFWGGKTDIKHYQKIWHQIKDQKESFTGNVVNRTIFGKQYHIALSIAPIFDEYHDVIFFVGIGKDITREKEIENAKDNFVSLVSHQLRTPLTSIKWLIELLLDHKTGPLNDKQNTFLSEAYTSTKRLALLVSDILSINRIEMGRVTIQKMPSDIATLITDVLQEMHTVISSKEILITRQMDSHLPLIDMDPILIRQVLMNIFSNAIKYTHPKGIVSVSVEDLHDRIRVTITDTGIGIPPREQGQIFERFYRASNAQESYAEGTGLGLFIAKMLITMCDGAIGFYSQENHGTTVWFTLPIRDTEKRG